MHALRVDKFSETAPLQLDTVPVPTLGSSQILVTVKAAGVNPVDAHVATSGDFPGVPPPPFTPGYDGAGVVEAAGSAVSKFKVGDRVFFCSSAMGAFAEKVVLEEADAGALGDALDFEQGAALGIPYLTAYRAIVQLGLAKKGQTVLVHGASGGVGIASTQLAKHLGLTVLGTAGTNEGLELVKGIGRADFAFNHNDPAYVDQIKGTIKSPINLIVENLANVNLHKDIDLIAQNGRIIIVGSRGEVCWNPATLFFKEVSLHGLLLASAPVKELADAMDAISAATTEGGWVRPVIAKRYSLNDGLGGGNDALRDVIIQAGGTRGKLVIVP